MENMDKTVEQFLREIRRASNMSAVGKVKLKAIDYFAECNKEGIDGIYVRQGISKVYDEISEYRKNSGMKAWDC